MVRVRFFAPVVATLVVFVGLVPSLLAASPLCAATDDSRRRQPRLCVLFGRPRLYRRSSTVGRA